MNKDFLFRFQTGSIKSDRYFLRGIDARISFDSKLVRLKVKEENLI